MNTTVVFCPELLFCKIINAFQGYFLNIPVSHDMQTIFPILFSGKKKCYKVEVLNKGEGKGTKKSLMEFEISKTFSHSTALALI